MDIVSYILSKKYTDLTVDGLGAIKGAPCTVQSIVDITDGKRVTLAWESNSGVEQTQSFDIMNGEDGDTIEWNQIQQSGTKIAEVVINGSKTNVYAPNGGGGAGGGHTIIDPAGNNMDQEDGLQFTGNVAVSDDSENGKTVINIPQEVVSLTQAQYNALPDSKLTDGKIYCISDSVGGVDGYPPLIYSDQEREIGVWRDGKPLYQKSISYDNSSTRDLTIDVTSLDIDRFVFFELSTGVMDPYNKSAVGSYMDNTDYINAYLDTATSPDQILHIRRGTDWAKCPDGYITIRYTKSTDTAGSGTWTTYGSYAHHYSTDEHVIGTWIDGKPLYEKTISFTTGNTNAYLNYVTDIENPEMMSIDFSASFYVTEDAMINATPYFGTLETGDSNTFAVLCNKVDNKLRLDYRVGSSAYSKSALVTIRYTKTTD